MQKYKHYIDRKDFEINEILFILKEANILSYYAEYIDFAKITKISLNDIICIEFKNAFLYAKVATIFKKKNINTVNCNFIDVIKKN